MVANKCRLCSRPIGENALILWWENEDEGRSGDCHMECVLKKVTRICKSKDCGSMYEDEGECSECGSPTRKINERDKVHIRNVVRKNFEMLKKGK